MRLSSASVDLLSDRGLQIRCVNALMLDSLFGKFRTNLAALLCNTWRLSITILLFLILVCCCYFYFDIVIVFVIVDVVACHCSCRCGCCSRILLSLPLLTPSLLTFSMLLLLPM